jgi:hypothetical protein
MSIRSWSLAVVGVLTVACSAGQGASGNDGSGPGAGGSAAGAGGAGSGGFAPIGGAGGAEPGCPPCSDDLTAVIDCAGNVVETCGPEELCGQGACMPACDAANVNQSSVGCDYYATAMAAMGAGFGGCFVAFVANTWSSPVHIQASFAGGAIDLAAHARIPAGSGPDLVYQPYDPAAGLPPGEVAILFLANDPVPHGNWMPPAACPVPAAVGLDAHVHYGLNISTGRTRAFHITTDKPVVSYQMLPFNAAYSASTGATLLLPTSAWGDNYVAAAASRDALWQGLPIPPTTSIIGMEGGTEVTILPTVDIQAGIGVGPATANVPVTYPLDAGEVIEFIQTEELTGSVISSNKPVAVFAGHMGLRIPFDGDWSDHAEQQIPPVRALGSEYAVASFRDRYPGAVEHRRHRLVGAVDGTVLTFDPPVAGAPTTLGRGTVAEFESDGAFVVASQDDEHPFMAFTYMGGSGYLNTQGAPAGYGDTDFVRITAGRQYLERYVFFTDPTYPETNLVVVRRKGDSGFADVSLDCAGVVGGWENIGSGSTYQVARVDLSRHDFEPQGACDNGRREMTSTEPFGVWVWGWGSPETRAGETAPCDTSQPDNSCDVSYGYPAGENVKFINDVHLLPDPR